MGEDLGKSSPRADKGELLSRLSILFNKETLNCIGEYVLLMRDAVKVSRQRIDEQLVFL